MIHGLDISHHNDPAIVPWADLAERGSFLYIRATYGTTRDRRVKEHFARAKEHGIQKIGLYHFFRATQTVMDQMDAFGAVAELVDYGSGDLIPALDIERDVSRDAEPWWSPLARQLAKMFADSWTDCMLYLTQREWIMLGRPTWVLERPLWVAHYTPRPKPATPNNQPWTIWQYRVGPYDPDPDNHVTDAKHPRALDHNIAVGLPIIRTASNPPDTERTPLLPLELSDEDWAEHRRLRDEAVKEP